MMSMDNGAGRGKNGTARIVFGYALTASLWILFSDRLLSLFPNKETILAISLLKGAFFVLVTSLFLYIFVSRELARRSTLEAELRRRLEEKEALLGELNHRVKNNLQVISSFFALERDLVEDEEDRIIFDDMQARIQSMALVHDRLYLAGDLGSIQLAPYTEGLAKEIVGIFDSKIMPSFELHPVSLGVNHALPFGLLLTEELSEAMLGAKWLRISVEEEPAGRVVLEIRRPEEAAEAGSRRRKAARAISGQIKEALAQQLGGKIVQSSAGGELSMRLFFPTR
jgi:two-component sensor histidine kinase